MVLELKPKKLGRYGLIYHIINIVKEFIVEEKALPFSGHKFRRHSKFVYFTCISYFFSRNS